MAPLVARAAQPAAEPAAAPAATGAGAAACPAPPAPAPAPAAVVRLIDASRGAPRNTEDPPNASRRRPQSLIATVLAEPAALQAWRSAAEALEVPGPAAAQRAASRRAPSVRAKRKHPGLARLGDGACCCVQGAEPPEALAGISELRSFAKRHNWPLS